MKLRIKQSRNPSIQRSTEQDRKPAFYKLKIKLCRRSAFDKIRDKAG
jgi:hypothetical protein